MNEKRAAPHYSILTHTNGTKTLVDVENGQAMHSRVGPVDEAKEVYANLARIEENLSYPTTVIRLYDVGMGTGANVLATLEKIQHHRDATGTLEVFSFESKPEGLRTALEAHEDFPWLTPWREQLLALLDTGAARFSMGAVDVDWKLFVGDFYSHYPKLPAPDFIYFDFYSPRVVPELWSPENFRKLRKHLGDVPCRLFTYSASTPTRMDLLLAGFFVGKGGSTGMKNETTVAAARFEDLKIPLTSEWLEHKLKTSSAVAKSPQREELIAHPQWKRT